MSTVLNKVAEAAFIEDNCNADNITGLKQRKL